MKNLVTMIVLFTTLLEGGSWLLFRSVFREPFSYTEARSLRNRRIDDASPVPAQPAASAPLFTIPHPYLGFVQNPALDPVAVASVHTVPVSEWGFLDDKPPLRSRDDHEVVVGIFGGSVAFWLSVKGVNAMLSELARVPQFRGKRFVVIRTALGGFKQPQQLMALNYLLALGGHFDVVLNIDGFNEVALAPAHNVEQSVFPFFPRSYPSLLGAAGDAQTVRQIGEIAVLTDRAAAYARLFSRPILRHSVFMTTLWRLLDRRIMSSRSWLQFDIETRARNSGGARNYAGCGPRKTYTTAAAMYADLVAVWERGSLQMQQLCAANGIRYFHVLHPNQYERQSKPMGAAEKRVAIRDDSPYAAAVPAAYPALRAAGKRLSVSGVDFYDLSGVFSAQSQPLYIDDCCHFNDEGNRLFGHAIGRHIAADLSRSQ